MNDATHHAVVFSTDPEAIPQDGVVVPVQPVDKLRRLLPFHWDKFHSSAHLPPLPPYSVVKMLIRPFPVK